MYKENSLQQLKRHQKQKKRKERYRNHECFSCSNICPVPRELFKYKAPAECSDFFQGTPQNPMKKKDCYSCIFLYNSIEKSHKNP